MKIGWLPPRFALLLLAVISIITASICVLARGGGDSASDPFTPYTDVIAGKLDSRFICKDVISANDELDVPVVRHLCVTYPTDDTFSEVTVQVGSDIYRVFFTIQADAITVGDLAIGWGRPHVRLARGQRMELRWPVQEVAGQVAFIGQFSYFCPLKQVIFVRRQDNLNFSVINVSVKEPSFEFTQ